MKKKVILKEQDLHQIVLESVKGVLKEIYPNSLNNSKLISLNETNAKRMIDRHTQNGFAIVSACRGAAEFNLDKTKSQDRQRLSVINKKRTKEMIEMIQSAGFSYTLSWGGFIENMGTETEENVYERSAIIYPQKRNGEVDVDGMRELALEICRKYNQESVLIKMPNDKPKYIRGDGSIDMTFTGDMSFNDLSQMYFTDLHKNTEKKMSPDSKPTRFTFLESYIAPIPQCYSESHVRHLRGEVFLKK